MSVLPGLPLPTDSLLATTLRAIGDGVLSCDKDGRVVLANAVALELTGRSEDDALGRRIEEVFVIVNETSRETVESPVRRVLSEGRIVGLANHTLLLRPDGTEIAIDDSAAPITDAQGELQGAVLVFRDVTERRRAERNLELLSESGRILGEERDRHAILQRISQEVSRHFADFCVFDLTRSKGEVRRTVGQHRSPARQARADGLNAFVAQEGVAPGSGAVAERESLEPVLLPQVTPEGLQRLELGEAQERYVAEVLQPKSLLSVAVEANGEYCGSALFVRDLQSVPFDERDRATAQELGRRLGLALQYAAVRESLREQRAQLDAVIANVPVGLLVSDRAGRLNLHNSEMERIFRHPVIPANSIDEHSAYGVFRGDGTRVQGKDLPLPQAMAQNRRVSGEFLYHRGDRTKAWVKLSAAPIRGEGGETIGGVVVVQDIDAEKAAREELERNIQRFELLVERAGVGINIGDASGGLTYVNPALLKVIGYTAEEVERGEVRWDDMTPPEFAAADQEALRQLRQTGTAQPYEKAYRAKDGHLVPMLIGATMIPGRERGSRDDIAVFFTDLSAQKTAEAALLQTEKLSAVGRLASSISHEINNPLEAVVNLLYIVSQAPELAQSTRDYLQSADRELQRVAQVTSQTLRFHRQSTGATTVRPEGLLAEVLGIYGSRLENLDVELRTDYATGVMMTCYEGDIRQVLNNLVSNALDAMRQGGVLTLRTEIAREYPGAPNEGREGVAVEVQDTGDGVPLAAEARVFDAFFTTKGIHGTGLGLWISKRIVHKHRGHLSLTTSRQPQHHGTSFRLWLPKELAETAREPWHEG